MGATPDPWFGDRTTLNARYRDPSLAIYYVHKFRGPSAPAPSPAPAPAPSDGDVGAGSSERQHFLDGYYRNGGRAGCGSPTGPTHWWNGIVIQDFRGGGGGDGALVDNQGVAHNTAFFIHGGIWNLWGPGMGGAASVLGRPLSDELPLAMSPYGTSGRYNVFERGTIVFCAKYGPHALYGSIRQQFLNAGGVLGRFGYPTTDVYRSGNTLYQYFENGGYITSPA